MRPDREDPLPDDQPHEPTPHEPTPRLLRATALAATVGVVVALLGLGLMLRPVTTPVQDCGTALGFVLDGRTNTFADPTDPPDGLTEAQVRSNNEEPCRERVADTIGPGAITFVVGLGIAVLAAAIEIEIRVWGWYHRRRNADAATDPAAATGQADGPPPT